MQEVNLRAEDLGESTKRGHRVKGVCTRMLVRTLSYKEPPFSLSVFSSGTT